MNTKTWAFLSLLIVLLGATARADELAAPDADGWSLVRDDQDRNIRAFARQEDDKAQRSYKVDASLNGKPEDLAAVLLDFADYSKWFWNVREAHLLKQVSPTEYYVYMVYESPYPLANRDCVLHAHVRPQSKGDGRFILTVSAAPDYLPKQPGLVRMPANQFSVVFQPQPGGRIETHVTGYMEAGGEVPAWAANFVQQAAPYYTVRGLQRMLERPKDLPHVALPFAMYNYEQLSLALR